MGRDKLGHPNIPTTESLLDQKKKLKHVKMELKLRWETKMIKRVGHFSSMNKFTFSD